MIASPPTVLPNSVLPLGSGGWIPTQERQTSSYLVRWGELAVVMDAGTGAGELTRSPELLDGVQHLVVLLSHFHLDHVVGLSYLKPACEVTVMGPGQMLYEQPTAEILGALLSPPFQHRHPLAHHRVVDVPPEGCDLEGLAVSVRPQHLHTSPSMGYRLGDLLAYCTDTEYDPGTTDFVAGVDLLMHEAWEAGAVEQGHTSGAEAARVARDADVGDLLLTHLHPMRDVSEVLEEARDVFARTRAAQDLHPVPIGDRNP